MMDEGRKRTLWICAAILAAPKLAEFKDGEKDALEVEIVRDAIMKAVSHEMPSVSLFMQPRLDAKDEEHGESSNGNDVA